MRGQIAALESENAALKALLARWAESSFHSETLRADTRLAVYGPGWFERREQERQKLDAEREPK
jgi:hypothetical protein